MTTSLADRLRPLRRLAGHVECLEVRLLGWSILSVLYRQRVLALRTTGRRSGKRRWTTVAYQEVDEGLFVVGGAGGQTRLPDWVANLLADPSVVIVRRRRSSEVTAVVLGGDERQATWDRLLPGWPFLPTYEARAGRRIPVIRLQPAGDPGR